MLGHYRPVEHDAVPWPVERNEGSLSNYYLDAGTGNTLSIRCDTGDTCSGVAIDDIQVSTEPTYNEGKDIVTAATATASSGTPANAIKGYVGYGQNEWIATSTSGWINLSWGSTPQYINKVVMYDKANSNNQVTFGNADDQRRQ